jgi:uncharacterized protein (DUF4213/DUF364 family)
LAIKPILKELKGKLQQLVIDNKLGNESVKVTIGTLTVKQAIGSPERQDYPLLQGKEIMIEAQVLGSYGQAFTDKPKDFNGSLNDALNLTLDTNENRAIFIATLNAVTSHLKMATGMRHCHDEEPEECAKQIARYIMDDTGKRKIGLIGLQPAILDHLVQAFGLDNVRCTDLNPSNVGSKKYGVEIWDARTDTKKLINWCDIVLVTASTINNNTFDRIKENANARGKRIIIFGVTGAGASALLGLERVCFQPH